MNIKKYFMLPRDNIKRLRCELYNVRILCRHHFLIAIFIYYNRLKQHVVKISGELFTPPLPLLTGREGDGGRGRERERKKVGGVVKSNIHYNHIYLFFI